MTIDIPVFEQLARRFETYANDGDASIRKKWVTGREAQLVNVRSAIWRDAAKELREIASDAEARKDMLSDIMTMRRELASANTYVEYILGKVI